MNSRGCNPRVGRSTSRPGPEGAEPCRVDGSTRWGRGARGALLRVAPGAIHILPLRGKGNDLPPDTSSKSLRAEAFFRRYFIPRNCLMMAGPFSQKTSSTPISEPPAITPEATGKV